MKRIFYRQANNEYALMYPTQELDNGDLTAVASRNVPSSCPFWIMEAEDIPATTEERNIFVNSEEIGEPAGYGSYEII